MSTRSNILLKDSYSRLMFYRHSDGYPAGHETLFKFMKAIKEGKLRNNLSQCSGWLIVAGFFEYNEIKQDYKDKDMYDLIGWKCGSYEPIDSFSSDIEYFYLCDVENPTIEIYKANFWKSKSLLFSDKHIKKAIEKGFLIKIGEIKDFSDINILQKIK